MARLHFVQTFTACCILVVYCTQYTTTWTQREGGTLIMEQVALSIQAQTLTKLCETPNIRLDSSKLRLSIKHVMLSQKIWDHFWLSITIFILSLKLEESNLRETWIHVARRKFTKLLLLLPRTMIQNSTHLSLPQWILEPLNYLRNATI